MNRDYFEVRRPDGSPLHEPPNLWPDSPLAWKFAAHCKGGAGESVGEAIDRLRREGFSVKKVRVTEG
jgi:hypothetical protein